MSETMPEEVVVNVGGETEEAPAPVDSGDTIVVTDGGSDGESDRLLGEALARITALEQQLAQTSVVAEIAEQTAETAIVIAEDAREEADVAEEVAEVAAETAVIEAETSDETTEEDKPPEGKHWFHKSRGELFGGKA